MGIKVQKSMLEYILKEHGNGKVAVLAEKMGVSPKYVYRVLKDNKKMETKEKVLEELTKEELIELIKQLQKEREHWKHRFQCVDKEYDVVCWKYHIPRY